MINIYILICVDSLTKEVQNLRAFKTFEQAEGALQVISDGIMRYKYEIITTILEE